MTMEFTLTPPFTIEEVDAEIVVVAGCALGFVAPGQPPHVLHVDPETELGTRGVRTDDVLLTIDGRDTRSLPQAEIASYLRGAKKLVFERPKALLEGDEDTEPPSEGERERAARDLQSAKPQKQAGDGESAPTGAAVARRGAERSRSHRRRGHRRGAEREHRDRDGGSRRFHHAPPAPNGVAQAAAAAAASVASISATAHVPARPGWGQDRGPPPPGWVPPVSDPSSRPPAGWAAAPGPPPHWAGPPPGAQLPGHAPPGYGHWRPPPPDHWRGPMVPQESPFSDPRGDASRLPPPQHTIGGRPPPAPQGAREIPRLERNGSGEVSLVAERLPAAVNNMDVLNEYFGTFGPVVNLQINHNRCEAIITFKNAEAAEEALRWPVLNDPMVGLRAWRGKAGQRLPHEMPSPNDAVAMAPAVLPLAAMTWSKPKPAVAKPTAPADGAPPATGAASPAGAVEAAPPADATEAANGGRTETGATDIKVSASTVPMAPTPIAPLSGNLILTLVPETGPRAEKNKQKLEMMAKRQKLLQSLTDQLKRVLARIHDSKTSEKAREQFQSMLSTIKEQINALTPKKLEPPPVPAPPIQKPRPPPRPTKPWPSVKKSSFDRSFGKTNWVAPGYKPSSRPGGGTPTPRKRLRPDGLLEDDAPTSDTEAMMTDIEDEEEPLPGFAARLAAMEADDEEEAPQIPDVEAPHIPEVVAAVEQTKAEPVAAIGDEPLVIAAEHENEATEAATERQPVVAQPVVVDGEGTVGIGETR